MHYIMNTSYPLTDMNFAETTKIHLRCAHSKRNQTEDLFQTS